jgi:serine/threonine-protein kinase
VVAYELLCGERPFANESVTAEAAAHANTPVPSIAERKNLPPGLDAVFQRALAKDTAARYGSATEFVADIRAALSRDTAYNTGRRPRPPRRLGLRLGHGCCYPRCSCSGAATVGAIVAVLVTPGRRALGDSSRDRNGPAGKVTDRDRDAHQQTVTASTPPPPPAPSSGSGGHALNDQGYQLIQQGNYAGAISVLQQAVQKLTGAGPADPYEAYANYNLGYALYRSGPLR